MVLVPSEAAKLLVGFIITVYSIPLVSGLGWRGIRFTSIEANPLARVRDTLEARWEVVIPSSWPVWRATARPSRLSWSTMVWWRPPRDSATKGTKARPSRWQSSPASLTFLV